MSCSFSKSPFLPAAAWILIVFLALPASAHGPHIITVSSSDLFPDGVAWDPSSQHFVVSSHLRPSLLYVSDAGVLQTLVSDPLLPPDASVLAISVDSIGSRLLAVFLSSDPFAFIAAYDLSNPPLHPRLFFSPLAGGPSRPSAVVSDALGNAYVASAAGDLIWKIDAGGGVSVFSNSSVLRSHPAIYSNGEYGITGLAYVSKGYFLAVQSGTGKMYKIDREDGSARLVLLPRDLPGAFAIALRSDGMAVVVARHRAWFVRSTDGWAEAMFCDEISLREGSLAKGVAVREGNRAYVLYGETEEGYRGNVEKTGFSIEELRSEKEEQGENIWMLVLLGFGLAYFCYWRFQMGRLVKEMNKKRA